jgi:Icc-related predicted phosphoesterase
MMKYAIMSDIHGNLEAFKAAVSDARKRGCGMMVCLGDLTGYGDRSRECVMSSMLEASVCREKDQEPRTVSTIPEITNCNWFI